jgi:hypothetical protein
MSENNFRSSHSIFKILFAVPQEHIFQEVVKIWWCADPPLMGVLEGSDVNNSSPSYSIFKIVSVISSHLYDLKSGAIWDVYMQGLRMWWCVWFEPPSRL